MIFLALWERGKRWTAKNKNQTLSVVHKGAPKKLGKRAKGAMIKLKNGP
jgi:hypothetical protein